MPDQITVTRWDRTDPPNESELYFLMEQLGYAPTLRGRPPGTRRTAHRHSYPEMTWVVSGWVRYEFPSATDGGEPRVEVLEGGDRIEVPPDVPHTTIVEGAAYAVYLSSSPWTLPLAPAPANVNV